MGERIPHQISRKRIVVAPQEFKGSLSAGKAADAMARGALQALPDAIVERAPIGDGGRGTVEAIVVATGGEIRRVECRDAIGRRIEGYFGLIENGCTAVVEASAAAGITRLAIGEQNPLHAGTEGVGDLIRAALDGGVKRLIVGLGGTASLDGGAGMARSLGVRFLDAAGQDLPSGCLALSELAYIDVSGADPRLRMVEISGAADVNTPLCGPKGISVVYGPQKGAKRTDVPRLDAALSHYAGVLVRQFGIEVRDQPWVGAGGGTGASLLALFKATVSSGFDLVAELTRLKAKLADAWLVLTGEGRLDYQSPHGKGTVGIAQLGLAAGVPVVALCGSLGPGWHSALTAGLTAAFSTAPGPLPVDEAYTSAALLLRDTAEQIVRLVAAGDLTSGLRILSSERDANVSSHHDTPRPD